MRSNRKLLLNTEDEMEKSKFVIKEAFMYGLTFFLSPFVGAFDEVTAAVNRPRAGNWKGLIVNDVRIYLAPLTGAVRGITKVIEVSHKIGVE